MRVAPNVELVVYRDLGNGDLQIQLAINGRLAPMIDDHKSNRERFPSEEAYFREIARGSEVLLHLYGDAREPLPEELILAQQERGF